MNGHSHPRLPAANAAARRFYLAGVAASALISGTAILTHGSAGTNTLLFGLTAQRLALFSLPCAVALLSIVGFIRACRSGHTVLGRRFTYAQRSALFKVHVVSWLLFGTLMMIPAARFRTFAAVYERLKPLFFLLTGWGLTGVFAFSTPRQRLNLRHAFARRLTPTFAVFLSLHCAFILLALISGFGIRSDAESWYEFSVPVLLGQAWVWVICAAFLIRLRCAVPRFEPPKIAIFFTIWALSAALFCLLPTRPHYFAPGPYPPANQFYPYSDAIFNDFAARTAIAGYGFSHGRTVLKPFPTFIFFLLQLATGDNVNAQLLVQSVLFGVVPALLFLFGNELIGTPVGLLSAGFRVFQELNAQRSAHVLTIHSRLEMTEWIAELCFLLFAWMIFRAIRARSAKACALHAAAAGTILAAAIYTRANFFAFFPAAILFFFLTLWKGKRRALLAAAVLSAALALTMLPWIIRSHRNTGEILPEVFGTYCSVILGQRFAPTSDSPALTPMPAPEHGASPIMALPAVSNPDAVIALKSEHGAVPSLTQPDVSSTSADPSPAPRPNTFTASVAHHSIRNILSLFFIPPTSFEFRGLDQVFTDADSPWLKSWTGQLTVELFFALFLNIIIFSFAVESLYRRHQLLGLNVTYWAIVYALSLGLSRTSGGRYVVPMNWIGVLLYSAGIAPFLAARSSGETSENRFFSIDSKLIFSRGVFPAAIDRISGIAAPILITLCFGVTFWSMIGIERFSSADAIAPVRLETLHAADVSLDANQLRADLEDGTILSFSGKVLYPRFYYYQTGETGADLLYKPKEYSRLVFRLMNKAVDLDVMLPLSLIPDGIEPGDNVTVFGCREAGAHYLDALLVLKTDAAGTALSALSREPAAPLRCPSREPICPEANDCY